LPDCLKVKFSNISLSELVIEGLGKDCWPVGLEADLYRHFSHLLPIALRMNDTLAFLGVDYESGLGAPFHARPPSELGAFAAWQAVGTGTLDVSAVININRVLGGSEELRHGRISTTPFKSGHKVLFDCNAPPEAFLTEWLDAFSETCAADQVLERAIWLFVDFLIAHPFSDGNGRTARMLLQTFLYSKGFLNAPILPLRPAILVNQRIFLCALWEWELHSNPIPLFEFMNAAIIKTKYCSLRAISIR